MFPERSLLNGSSFIQSIFIVYMKVLKKLLRNILAYPEHFSKLVLEACQYIFLKSKYTKQYLELSCKSCS